MKIILSKRDGACCNIDANISGGCAADLLLSVFFSQQRAAGRYSPFQAGALALGGCMCTTAESLG